MKYFTTLPLGPDPATRDGPAGKGAEAGPPPPAPPPPPPPPPPTPAGKGGTAGKGGPAGKQVRWDEWSCGFCTLLNPPVGAIRCQLCDTPRAAPTVAPATGTTADTGAPATGTPADTDAPATGTLADHIDYIYSPHTADVPWVCFNCTFQNPADAAQCSVCQFPQLAAVAPLPIHGTVPAAE